MGQVLLSLGIGLLAGVLSGLFGIGGGIVIVPALIFALGFGQTKAQGTSLAALLLPVGALGVWRYWQDKQVDIQAGLLVAVGLLGGALVGANIAVSLDPVVMRKCFAVFLVAVACLVWFKK